MVTKLISLMCVLANSFHIQVLFSHSTPESLESYFRTHLLSVTNSPDNYFELSYHKVSLNQTLHLAEKTIYIDATFNLLAQESIRSALENKQALVFGTGSFGLSLHNSEEAYSAASIAFLNFLGWKRFLIVTGNSEFQTKVAQRIQNHLGSYVYDRVVIQNNLSQTSTQNLVGRVFKPQGISNFFVMTAAGKFSEALVQKKLYKKGSGLVVVGPAWTEDLKHGTIGFIQKGLEEATSYEDYELLALKTVTETISEIKNQNKHKIGIEDASFSQVVQYFNQNWNKKPPEFTVLNYQNGKRAKVGSIVDGQLTMHSSDLVFPGNTSSFPTSAKTIITVGIGSGASEPYSETETVYNPIQMQGAHFARFLTNNSSSILEHFQIEYSETDCGVSVYEETWYKECFEKQSDLGVAYISPGWSAGSLGTILSFRDLGIEIPISSPGSSSPELSSQQNYPEFMRMSTSISYTAVIIPIILNVFGFKNCAVLAPETGFYHEFYQSLVSELEKQEIKVLNTLRHLPELYMRENFEDHKEVFQEVAFTKARVVIVGFASPYDYHVFEGLYDIGLRKGDIVGVLAQKTGGNLAAETQEAQLKRQEMLVGSLSLQQSEWVGSYGEELEKGVKELYGDFTAYKCYAFDASMLINYSIDFMIARGEDFEDPELLNKYMREERFQGCGGTVSIESGKNDRRDAPLSLQNVIFEEEEGFVEKVVGLYNPTASTVLTFYEDVIWPDGTTQVPKDLRIDPFDCPFKESEIVVSEKGRGLLYVVAGGVSLVTVVISYCIYKKYWKETISELTEQREMSFEDMMVNAFIWLEFFQYISAGPEAYLTNPLVGLVSESSSANLESLIDFRKEMFWWAIKVSLGLVVTWVVLGLVVLLRIDIRWSSAFVFRWMGTMAEYLMPVLGDLAFLPIVSMIMNLYLCDGATGPSLSDTFLSQDCYETCWEGKHLAFAILGFLGLLLYLPLAVYCRPWWQELQDSLNIKTSPAYLIVKSIFQVLCIVMNKTIKRSVPKLHGCIYIVAFGVFTYFVMKNKPYNYGRTRLWQVTSLVGVTWSCFVTTSQMALEYDRLPFLVVQVTGWVVILGGAFVVQKRSFPSYLYRPKAPDIAKLFRFLLGSKVSASDLDGRGVNYLDEKYYEEPSRLS